MLNFSSSRGKIAVAGEVEAKQCFLRLEHVNSSSVSWIPSRVWKLKKKNNCENTVLAWNCKKLWVQERGGLCWILNWNNHFYYECVAGCWLYRAFQEVGVRSALQMEISENFLETVSSLVWKAIIVFLTVCLHVWAVGSSFATVIHGYSCWLPTGSQGYAGCVPQLPLCSGVILGHKAPDSTRVSPECFGQCQTYL